MTNDEPDLERFYQAIWTLPGHRCLATPYRSGKGFNHIWGETTEELLGKTDLAQAALFHSVATFRKIDASDKLKDGLTIGELRRFKSTVLWSKCGHNEIDIRDGKESYADVDGIIEAIAPVEQELGQRALIVWSGKGAHLYWPYGQGVDYRTWWSDVLYRERLFTKYCIRGHDAPVARDRARILRVPGSINEKYGTPVRLVRWHDRERTPRYVPQIGLDTAEQEDKLQDRRYRKLTPELVAEHCAQVRRLREHPERQTYNEWLGCASVLRRVPGGREAFLEWSAGDKERFDYDDTESKLDSLTGKDAQKCESFLGSEPGSVCLSCEAKARKFNPLTVTLQASQSQLPVVEPEDTPLPEGYTILNGRLVVGEHNPSIKGSSGLPVASKPFYVDGLYLDEATNKKTVLLRYLESNGAVWKTVSAAQGKALAQPATVFGDNLALTDRARAYIFDSLTCYEQRLTSEGRDAMLPVVKYMGWHKSTKGEYCFNYGDKVISERGVFKVIVDTANPRMTELANLMETEENDPSRLERDYQDWQVLACEYANDPSVPLGCRVFFLLGFVAPTVRLIAEGHQFGGLVANIWGETGWGKTLAQTAAMGIYGKPKMILPVNVSEAALYHAISCTPNLPVCIDEFTSGQVVKAGAKAIHDFIKSFADGAAPARMNSDGTPRPSKSWNTLALTAANERYVDLMRAYGGQDDVRAAEMRVVELPLPGRAEKPRIEALRSMDYSAFSRLTGLAGPRWIRHLCKPSVQASLNAWVAGYKCDKLPLEARYHIKLAALMEWTMRELWHESRPAWLEDGCLGMVKFPFQEIMDFYFSSCQGQVKESKAAHVLPPLIQSILNFLDDHKDRCAVYASYPPGEVPVERRKKELRPTNDDLPRIRNGEATNSFVTNTRLHFIPHNALMNYHNKRMGSRGFTAEIEALVKEGVTKKVNHRVNGYVNYERGEEPCWRFPRDIIENWMRG
jgi:Domain of unknown function (DUF927)